jgi:hypothetical protein
MDTTLHPPGTIASPRRALDLDQLAAMDSAALGRLYAAGRVTDVTPLVGHPRGRMLAVRGLDRGRASGVLRRFAAAHTFPWGGKSFAGRGVAGTGANRVHLFGRHQLFHFHTSVGASVIDGAPTIVLDYDLPDNPGLIRAIHDEVRAVDEGLFLGPAMWKTARGPQLVLWFALDLCTQSPPIGARWATA